MINSYESETPDPPLVLIVDGDLANLRQLSNILKKNNYLVAFAGNGNELAAAMDNAIPDLIISDMNIPGLEGVNLCERFASIAGPKPIPVIFMIPEFDDETIENLFKNGAADYIIKPAIFSELLTRLANHLNYAKLAGERKILLKEIERISIIDSLTELFSRDYIVERLGEEIAEASRYAKDLSIALFEVDHMKTITDLYGHEVSDEVIAKTAITIIKELREVDIIGRYNTDTFMAIMPSTGGRNALTTAQRVRKRIEQSNRYPKELKITVSGGVGSYCDEEEAELILKTLTLVERAKKAGGNRIIYDDAA